MSPGKVSISTHTVCTHLGRLYRKLEVTSRCAAVVRVFAEYLNQESPNATATTAMVTKEHVSFMPFGTVPDLMRLTSGDGRVSE